METVPHIFGALFVGLVTYGLLGWIPGVVAAHRANKRREAGQR